MRREAITANTTVGVPVCGSVPLSVGGSIPGGPTVFGGGAVDRLGDDGRVEDVGVLSVDGGDELDEGGGEVVVVEGSTVSVVGVVDAGADVEGVVVGVVGSVDVDDGGTSVVGGAVVSGGMVVSGTVVAAIVPGTVVSGSVVAGSVVAGSVVGGGSSSSSAE